MQRYVKEQIKQFQGDLCSALVLLKRFEGLKLDCLALDRRYLDIAVLFAKEVQHLKDV